MNSFRERLFKAKHKEEDEDLKEKVEPVLGELGSILTHKLDVEEEVKRKFWMQMWLIMIGMIFMIQETH